METIVFICPKEIGPGVTSSQVVLPAHRMAREDGVEVVLFVPKKNASAVDQEKFTGQVHLYNEPKEILGLIPDHSTIYIRSVFDFVLVWKFRLINRKSWKLLYSFRGIIHEESFLRNKSHLRKAVLFAYEFFTYKMADRINVVSSKMEQAVIHKFGRKPITTTPCCVEGVVEKTWSEPTEGFKFVYLGSLHKWQCFEEVLRIYKTFLVRFPNASLTVITRDEEEAKKMAFEVLGEEAKHVAVGPKPHDEVLRILPEFDFGFLIRKKNIVNETASPIKFLEYVSRGVIPVISEGIGDYSEEISRHKVGVLVDENLQVDLEELELLRNDPAIYQRLVEFSKGYTWETLFPSFKKMMLS